MKFKNASKTGKSLLALGLLLAASSGIIKDFVHIPDFFRGVMMGVGAVSEITGFILIRKGANPFCKSNPEPSIK